MSDHQFDQRRAQYVPLDTSIAFGKTKARLVKKFGRDGLLTWVLFLAACKRSREQGTFCYTSEAEGWQLIGLDYPDTPTFTLDEFFVFTGRGGGTRLVRQGSIRRCSVVNWKSWNEEWKKQQGSERMSRKREENKRTLDAHKAHDASTEVEVELEVEDEVEGEVEAPQEPPPSGKKNCPVCGPIVLVRGSTMADHMYATHGVEASLRVVEGAA